MVPIATMLFVVVLQSATKALSRDPSCASISKANNFVLKFSTIA